jgi:S-100/ICaBP type calcium binding domain
MNDRIKELAEQANELDYETFDNYNHKTVQHYKFNKEKFAELIVKECADFLKDTLDDHFAAEQLEEHFGVEE